jgi:hypothetical protein
MARAKPYPLVRAGAPKKPKAQPQAAAAGQVLTIAPALPQNANAPAPKTQPSPTSAKVASGTYPYPFRRYVWRGAETRLPARTIGKIFFDEDGEPYVCSGSVVNSNNKSVVWTAGHCVIKGGSGNGWHENWIFVPAFRPSGACSESDNGARCPYGQWIPRDGRSMFTTTAWASRGGLGYDVAAVVVAPKDGTSIVNRLGGQGITFNRSPREFFRDFGYPEQAPFYSNLFVCEAATQGFDHPDTDDNQTTLGIGCDMTGGASGGPWVIGARGPSGLGWVNSVNSYKYNSQPAAMYGPYLGTAAMQVFQAAEGY